MTRGSQLSNCLASNSVTRKSAPQPAHMPLSVPPRHDRGVAVCAGEQHFASSNHVAADERQRRAGAVGVEARLRDPTKKARRKSETARLGNGIRRQFDRRRWGRQRGKEAGGGDHTRDVRRRRRSADVEDRSRANTATETRRMHPWGSARGRRRRPSRQRSCVIAPTGQVRSESMLAIPPLARTWQQCRLLPPTPRRSDWRRRPDHSVSERPATSTVASRQAVVVHATKTVFPPGEKRGR